MPLRSESRAGGTGRLCPTSRNVLTEPILFTNSDGRRGVIRTASGTIEANTLETEILLEDGQMLRVPTEELVRNHDGSYTLHDERVIPVVEESLEVAKRIVPTGTVRIFKRVTAREERVDEPLRTETYDLHRVPINQPVDGPIAVRQEGDTSIYSVVEEVAVVTKQWILREELHVTRHVGKIHKPQTILLKREEVTVERSLPQQPLPNPIDSEGPD